MFRKLLLSDQFVVFLFILSIFLVLYYKHVVSGIANMSVFRQGLWTPLFDSSCFFLN